MVYHTDHKYPVSSQLSYLLHSLIFSHKTTVNSIITIYLFIYLGLDFSPTEDKEQICLDLPLLGEL